VGNWVGCFRGDKLDSVRGYAFRSLNEFDWYLAQVSEASELCAERRVASLSGCGRLWQAYWTRFAVEGKRIGIGPVIKILDGHFGGAKDAGVSYGMV
jgi:hypothetical protein